MPRISRGTIANRFFFAYSQIGRDHIDRELPNQDNYAYAYDRETACFAVSDGLGSCRFSGIGSETASSRIVQEMIRLADAPWNERGILEHFTRSIRSIREELDRIARSMPQTPSISDEFAATLLFVMIRSNTLFAAQIGDGAIYGITEHGASLIVEPFRGSVSNETVPITAFDWETHLRTRFIDLTDSDRYVCLMTDGFADPIRRPEVVFGAVSDALACDQRETFAEWAGDLNEYFEDNGFSRDDKTLLIVMFSKDDAVPEAGA